MQPADEIVTIVDEQNTVVGAARRGDMRLNRWPHRSTYVMVFNSQNELYVQKRSLSKDIFPGYYDPFAGGVVLAGESYEVGAKRELEEEMGIRNVPLTHHFEFYYEDDLSRVWGSVFSCVYDGTIVLQAEEVESGAFYTIDNILQQAKTERYTPDGLCALDQYLNCTGYPMSS